jgi:hypothetical protein
MAPARSSAFRPVGFLIAIGVLFMLFGCMAPPGGVLPLPAPAEPTEVPSSGDPGDISAIRDVIQRANNQQEQAITTRDSSPMRETSTDRYYGDMVRVNQDLLNNGVASIKLDQIEWGGINVTGNFAQATTWETWATTAQDGRTARDRERNVYRLVREGGGWKIDANDHPDSAPPGLPPFRPGPEV